MLFCIHRWKLFILTLIVLLAAGLGPGLARAAVTAYACDAGTRKLILWLHLADYSTITAVPETEIINTVLKFS